MHEVVYHVAIVWMTILLGVCVVLVIGARSALSRILTLDMLALILIGVLALAADRAGVAYLLDVALALALLSFIATIAAVRYYERGTPFS